MTGIRLDEDFAKWPIRFDTDNDGVELSGPASDDQEQFLDRLSGIGDRERITRIWVKADSQLCDCSFLTRFPNVETLFIASQHMQTLYGLNSAKNLRRLVLETGKKNHVDIGAIRSMASLKHLRIGHARSEDLKAVANSKIETLELIGGEVDNELESLAGAALSQLVIVGMRAPNIGMVNDTSIRHLHVAYCKDFPGFSVPMKSVEHAIVESCGRFDIATLNLLEGIRSVRILACKMPFDFGSVPAMPHVTEVVITNCKVSFDHLKLHGMASLDRIWISPVRAKIIRQISEENIGVIATNGNVAFRNGEELEVEEYYAAKT